MTNNERKQKSKTKLRYFDKTDDSKDEDNKKDLKPLIKNIDFIKPINKLNAIQKNKATIPHKNKFRKINPAALKRHSRGEGLIGDGVKTNFFKKKILRKEKKYIYANEQAARTEILLNEEEGFIIPNENECTAEYTQSEIVANVDITAATKRFDLHLEFGKYNINYTKNGRHLLLGGRRGHVAAFDWVTKSLHCEFNAMEEIFDVKWLHVETMFAVAQKKYVHIYDNHATELHCVKKLCNTAKMEFLPYHFLLACASENGYLNWLDVSIGEIVASHNVFSRQMNYVCQNPSNGVICIGNKGVVSMWAPSVKEPLAKIMCHAAPITALTVDPSGCHMATGSVDNTVKLWDTRNLGTQLSEYNLNTSVTNIDLSQKQLMAISMGNICEVYKNVFNIVAKNKQTYLRHNCTSSISNIKFCPFEDILGMGLEKGFTSILVPGAGEANYDALEANPYQTKSQRRENEVKLLLEKIPSDLICLDPTKLGDIDVPTLRQKLESKSQLLHMRPPKINFEPRKKANKFGGAANANKSKKYVKEMSRKRFIKDIVSAKHELLLTDADNNDLPENNITATPNVLDRFKTKIKKKN